jgi:hypothetical protein
MRIEVIMKKLIFILSVIFTFTSCDAPRDRRLVASNSGADLGLANASAARVDLGTGTSTGTTTGSTTTTTTNPVIPTDAVHCKFSTDGINGFESTSTHLGNYTLCQSSTDKNTMYFQLQTPPKTTTSPATDISICFIPTTSSGTNSIYVGNPMCGTFPTATDVRKITFVKFPQYQSAVINGAIFFKDLAFSYPYPFNSYVQTMTLDAYKTCMQAISTPPYYNPAFCQAFKQVGQYVYRQF